MTAGFLSILIPIIAGFLLLRLSFEYDGEYAFEWFFYAIGLGYGLLSYAMFLLGLIGARYSPLTITVVFAVVVCIALVLLFRFRGVTPPKPGRSISEKLSGWRLYLALFIAAWVLVRVGFVFCESFSRPIFTWDAVSNWSAGAKLFYYDRGLVLNPGDENFFGMGYRVFLGHPLHTILLQVWTALWVGRFSEVYVKAWSFFYYIGVLGVFYYAVKREAGTFYAFLALFFLSSVPLLTYHGMVSYSDLPLSFYALASTVCFFRYTRTGNMRLLSLSSIFLAMGCFTKNEGLFFFIAVGFALLLFLLLEKKPLRRSLIHFLLPFALVIGPWFVFKYAYGFGFGHSDAGSGFNWLSDPTYGATAGRGVHWEIFGVFFKRFFMEANFNLIFPFWLFVTVFYIRKVFKTDVRYLYTITLSVIAMFLFVYLTLEVTAVTENTGVNRNALTYIPLIFFTTAVLCVRQYLPSSAAPGKACIQD